MNKIATLFHPKIYGGTMLLTLNSSHESRRGKVLHVTIREPNGCNLKSKSQKEKLIGEKYLERWELVETVQ